MLPTTRQARLSCYGTHEGYSLAMALQSLIEQADPVLAFGPGHQRLHESPRDSLLCVENSK